jgi:hypothetical protein
MVEERARRVAASVEERARGVGERTRGVEEAEVTRWEVAASVKEYIVNNLCIVLFRNSYSHPPCHKSQHCRLQLYNMTCDTVKVGVVALVVALVVAKAEVVEEKAIEMERSM